jgi:N-methylhydantoinase A
VGFLSAPLAFDFVRTSYGRLDELDWPAVNQIYAEMEGSGRQILLDSGVPEGEISYARSADVRYVGQGYEVRVPLPAGTLDAGSRDALVAAFEAVYKQLYGRIGPNVGLEIMSWRLVVSGPRPSLQLRAEGPDSGMAEQALKGQRRVYHPEWREYRETPVYDRYTRAPGATFVGPAIVEERESTVVIGPGGRCAIDELRNLRVDLS